MMRRIFALLFSLVGIAFSSYSQHYSKSFLINNLNTIPDVLSIIDNKVYSIGIYPDTSLSVGIGIKSYMSKFSNDGVLTAFNTFRPEQYYSFSGTFYNGKSMILDENIVSCGYTEDTGTFQRNYLVCFYDTNLSISKYFAVPTGITNGTLTSIVKQNNHFYATGTKNNAHQSILLKLDTMGNKIRELNYNITSLATINLAQTIIAVDSGDLLIAIGGYREFPDWGQHHLLIYKTTLIRCDSLGGEKWLWTDPSNNGQAPYSFQKTRDGGYVSCGSYVGNRVLIREIPSGILLEDFATFHPYIVKWNSDFTKQWEKYFDRTDSSNTGGEFFDIKETQDGSFISCGYGGQAIGTAIINGGWLQKTDRNGEVLWRRFYKPYGYDTLAYFFRLYDLDFADNGDIIAIGEYDPPSSSGLIPQQGWILRVDSNGCIVDSNYCGWSSVEVEPTMPKPLQAGTELYVYPNPANDLINVTFANSIFNLSDKLILRIIDIQGREVLYSTVNYKEIIEFDISKFERGIYFVKINSEDNKVLANGKFVKE